MKMTLHILTLGILILVFSCGHPNEKKNVSIVITDTFQSNLDKKEKERLEKRKVIEEEERLDSIRLDKILQKALSIAKQNIDKEIFAKDFETIDTTYGDVTTNLTIGNFFSKTHKHLIVKRKAVGDTYINAFSVRENGFQPVIYHKQWNIEYVNDTIQDINGDNYFDFVVNWYGSSGCCLKAFSNVYLFQPDKASFTKDFEFINPTFSPNEKIIRGVCYGQPGETEMYKYKWNGEFIDTLEYVSYEKNDKGVKTGKIIISKNRPYGDKFKKMKVLNSIPTEYRKIDGYDWFTGKGYE